jgi:hypothetical protein
LPIIVWAVVAILVWRYGTGRLVFRSFPDGGRDFVEFAGSERLGTPRGEVVGDDQA